MRDLRRQRCRLFSRWKYAARLRQAHLGKRASFDPQRSRITYGSKRGELAFGSRAEIQRARRRLRQFRC